MTCSQRTFLKLVEHCFGKCHQTKRVGNVAAALADRLGELLLRVVEAVDQLLVAHRFFDRVQVSALNVFDDRDFQNFLVGELPDEYRDGMQAGLLGCPPASFARYDLKGGIVADWTDDYGLQDALLCD